MIILRQALRGWGAPDFEAELRRELERLPATQLPLQQGLTHSSYVSGDPFRVMVLGVSDAGTVLQARVGIFYSGVIAGCNCADDPTPIDVQPEYCELQLAIDKATAKTAVTLLG